MSPSLAPLLDHVRRLAAPPQGDADLLARFRLDRDAAEDAFQATFLLLARRAGQVGRPDALGGWLYGVALRVARKARSAAPRRHERQAPGAAEGLPAGGPSPEERVGRLPEGQRQAVLLCCLEGLTLEEAAARLGCTPGSVKGRLERGRA